MAWKLRPRRGVAVQGGPKKEYGMAVETQEVRELIDFAPEGFLVTSFYLNVDARGFPSPDHIATSLDSVIHGAQIERDEVARNLEHDASESLRTDLEKIEDYIKEEFERQDTNGVGIFSCAGKDFWEVVSLP